MAASAARANLSRVLRVTFALSALRSVLITGDQESNGVGESSLLTCVLHRLTFGDGADTRLFSSSAARWVAASFLAAEHINSRNCTALGEECNRLLPMIDELVTETPLDLVLMDLEGDNPETGIMASLECLNAGGKFMIGSTTSAQSMIISQITGPSDQFLISSASTSPDLSNSVEYKNFARTALSAEYNMKGLADFISYMGWKQVVILHDNTMIHYVMEELFEEILADAGVKVQSMSTGRRVTDSSLTQSMAALESTGAKVVIVIAQRSSVPSIMDMASKLLTEFKSYTWLLANDDVEDVVIESIETMKGMDDSSTHVMEGMLGVTNAVQKETSEMFKALLKDSKERFIKKLKDSKSIRDLPAETMQPLLEEVEYSLDFDGKLDMFTLTSYDAVWALVAAITASRAESPDTILSGAALMQQIRLGNVPRFQGLSNWAGFDIDGDAVTSDVELQIKSFARYNGTRNEPIIQEVGAWTASDGVTLNEQVPIIWADGQSEKIPEDGLRGALNWYITLLAATTSLVIIMMVLLVICMRCNADLKNQVSKFQFDQIEALDIAIESPLSKALDFLIRYQSARPWIRPSRKEAQDLHKNLIDHQSNLNQPDLDDVSFTANDETKMWIVESLKTDTLPAPFLPKRRRPSQIPAESRENLIIARSAESLLSRDRLKLVQGVEVPSDAQDDLCTDMFFDTITEQSLLHEVSSPLAVVAKASVQRLQRVAAEKVHLSDTFMLQFVHFAYTIGEGYEDNGYHCKFHAADVTNRLMAILATTKLDVYFDVGLAALVAACVHDYKHPQRNNLYLNATDHFMAEQFNYQAPAENYSAREGLSIISKDGFNFLSTIKGRLGGKPGLKHFKRTVTNMVLATEMAKHFDILAKFEAQVVGCEHLQHKYGEDKWEAMNPEQKGLTLQIAIKVADLGHCALPLDQHKLWIGRLEEEFFEQGDQEVSLGLPISPMMNRNSQGVSHPDSQVGFFQVFVIPLLTSWTKVFPECNCLLDEAMQNLNHWDLRSGNTMLERGRISLERQSSSIFGSQRSVSTILRLKSSPDSMTSAHKLTSIVTSPASRQIASSIDPDDNGKVPMRPLSSPRLTK